MSDYELDQEADYESETGETNPPIYITLCRETLDEAREMVNEVLDELRLTMEETDPQYGLSLPFKPEHVGIGFPMDTAYEVSVCFYAVNDGEEFRERGEVLEQTLLTMDKTHNGQPNPVLLRKIIEYILSDALPLSDHVAWKDFEEPLAEGDLPIVLVDQMGIDIDTRDI